MDFLEIKKEIEDLGCTVAILDRLDSKGRYFPVNGEHFIFLRSDTSDVEKINILLHEKRHLINQDTENTLSSVDTYKHRIEHTAEKSRILDFMSLVDTEYPIDENFNYVEYMKSACIPPTYESYVKEIAKEFYNKNNTAQ